MLLFSLGEEFDAGDLVEKRFGSAIVFLKVWECRRSEKASQDLLAEPHKCWSMLLICRVSCEIAELGEGLQRC